MSTDAAAVPLHLRPSSVALVFIGGAAGTGLRYGLGRVLPTVPGNPVWSTLTANLVGAFILGVLLETLVLARLTASDGRSFEADHHRAIRLLVGTGVCGGLTTYSTFALDLRGLLAGGHAGVAVGYAALTVIGGFLVAAFGIALARGIRRNRSAGRRRNRSAGRRRNRSAGRRR
jgi:CrcB protein